MNRRLHPAGSAARCDDGPLSDVDLHEVKADEKMEISVPVQPPANRPASRRGRRARSGSHALRIRCLPKICRHSSMSMTELHVGQTIHIRELKAVPGVVFLATKNQPVVSCVNRSRKL